MKDLFMMVMPLIIISVILLGALFVVKKFSLAGKIKNNGLLDFQLIASYSLMPKKYLAVVKIQDEYLLLGISDSNVNLIKELDIKPEDLEKANPVETNNKFLDIFKKAMKGS